jgi:hypothetical protein
VGRKGKKEGMDEELFDPDVTDNLRQLFYRCCLYYRDIEHRDARIAGFFNALRHAALINVDSSLEIGIVVSVGDTRDGDARE